MLEVARRLMVPPTHTPGVLRISIVVPVHNGGDGFRQCLISLFKACPAPDEIIVVANGDSDGSSSLARKPELGCFDSPRRSARHGPGTSAPCAQRATSYCSWTRMSPSRPMPSTSQTAFDHYQDLAAIFGSYDDAPGASNFLSQYKNLLHHYIHQTSHERACTFWGACGSDSPDGIPWIGGFDECYQLPSIEDIELGYRLTKNGHRIRLCKRLQVKHLKHWRLGYVAESRGVAACRPMD